MKTRVLLVGVALAALGLMQPLGAATATSNVTVSATVAAAAKLTLGASTVTFPDADPESVPSINASEGAISITAKGRTSASGTITLTLKADDDLISGTDTIAISNVQWTASGMGYSGGTMNKTTAQTVGSWTGSGTRTGAASFRLANSWDYVIGSYSVGAVYTLTAP